DQKFNLLMGRELQKQSGQSPQCVITMPLLEGLDGVQKMSKSLGNYIGINEAPEIIFAKIMSISDELMWRYIELLSFASLDEIESWKVSVKAGQNPRDIKVNFAQEIVTRFHSKEAAIDALDNFQTRSKGGIPENVPAVNITIQTDTIGILQLLKEAALVASTSEGIRLMEGGGIKIDGERLEDGKKMISKNSEFVAQVGKRKFAKIKVL
ncbi:MAG: Tyrosine--tRNA ligase, partial [Pseudomonadota bacterium]